MWLKILKELLPHAVPVARQYLSPRTADPNDGKVSEAIRHDLAEVSTSNKSLAHQLEEQNQAISDLQSEIDLMLPALQNATARLSELQEQTASLSLLLRITLFFAFAATAAAFTAIILILRHS